MKETHDLKAVVRYTFKNVLLGISLDNEYTLAPAYIRAHSVNNYGPP